MLPQAEKRVRAGDLKGALALQEEINQVCEYYKDCGNQMAACKLILYWQGLIDDPRKVWCCAE